MSNSSLATYKLLSPNHSGQRTMPIDRITPHCVVGQLSAAGICGCFTSSSVQASCNYGIGKDGDIGLCVEEKNRSWCTSSNANDQRAVTIECASDRTDPYAFTDKCYNSLVNLCIDICKRNGKKKLIWFGDKTKTLNYSPKSDEMILTVHRWFAAKSCPGNWMYARMGDLANKVTARLSGESIDTSTSTSSSTKYYRVRKTWSDEKSQLGAYTILQNAKDNCPVGYSVFDESGKAVYTHQPSNNSSSTSGTHTSEFAYLTDKQSAAKLLEVATPIAKEYGLLPSVLAAQCVLESGFCKTELAKKADNILGMKTNLLNSTWTSPTWDGKSSVTILTPEYYNGVKVMVNAPFRKYSCIEDCMKDRCAFFLNAKVSVNAAHPKYYGVTNCKTYKEQITFIKEHGYATDPNYISKVCDIIKRYSLDANDGFSSTPSTPSQSSIQSTTTTSKTLYRVATSYSGGKYVGQIGAYEVFDNAKKAASEASQSAKKTYYVYDNAGTVVYTAEYKSSSTSTGSSASKKLYDVKVTTTDLRIRKTPNGAIKGYIKPGVYGITEEKTVNGLKWGHLLSGAGWIALKYATRL